MPQVFKLPKAWRLAVLLFLVVPIAAWALVKPVRVLAPGLVGIDCQRQTVCVDDPSKLAAATALYAESQAFVAAKVGSAESAPRLIFCSTEQCAQSFGLGARSAVTLGLYGTVIGPRAWKPFYVRHEMIHHLQGERLGVLRLLLKPGWLVEGMAYALSEDPRPQLMEPFETDRQRFRAWLGTMDSAAMWERAAKE